VPTTYDSDTSRDKTPPPPRASSTRGLAFSAVQASYIRDSTADVLCCGVLCRVPTTYDSDSEALTIKHTPERDACQYAYFAPYTYNRHRLLIARTQVKAGYSLESTLVAGTGVTPCNSTAVASCRCRHLEVYLQ
jgi:hypothetical protein